jgi:hypothetical protein
MKMIKNVLGGGLIVAASFGATLFAIDYFGVGPQRIIITEVNYGNNCGLKPGNFSLYAAKLCDHSYQCNLEVYKMGDPAPGCGKSFSAKFVCYRYGPIHEVSIPVEAFDKTAALSCADS